MIAEAEQVIAYTVLWKKFWKLIGTLVREYKFLAVVANHIWGNKNLAMFLGSEWFAFEWLIQL